ncbi:MAG: DsrE family protein [Gammaproteobacteria bacterium]|jgi:uncharacterized protein involved in oxidation of intracellular sulfur|nr:DsrE family protein [Gammaproteobacteria bacterium]
MSNPFLFTLASFDADADRVAASLVLANNALAVGSDVTLWLTLEGVELAKTGAARELKPVSFPPVSELLDQFVEQGGRIGVCPPCGKTHGLTDGNMMQGAEWMGAAAVVGAAQESRTISF